MHRFLLIIHILIIQLSHFEYFYNFARWTKRSSEINLKRTFKRFFRIFQLNEKE